MHLKVIYPERGDSQLSFASKIIALGPSCGKLWPKWYSKSGILGGHALKIRAKTSQNQENG